VLVAFLLQQKQRQTGMKSEAVALPEAIEPLSMKDGV
jgi:hypothetical protein